MGDQDNECGDLLAVKVQETALEFGGPAWVSENVHEGDGGHIIEGKIIGWAPGRTRGGPRAAMDRWWTTKEVRQPSPRSSTPPAHILISSYSHPLGVGHSSN